MIDRYENLANAIILQAVKDYRRALKRLVRNRGYEQAIQTKNDVERFFHSELFSMLTNINGEELVIRLRTEVA